MSSIISNIKRLFSADIGKVYYRTEDSDKVDVDETYTYVRETQVIQVPLPFGRTHTYIIKFE